MTNAAVRRPRVLQVITKLDLGGAEGVAVDLVDRLHADVEFGVFAVFALAEPTSVGRDMAQRLARCGAPVFTGTRGHFKKGGAVVAAWRLAWAVKHFRADIVHLHTEVPELTYAIATLLAPRLRKVAVLRTVHNCELWIAWGSIGRWVTRRLSRSAAIAVSYAAAAADAAIAAGRARVPAKVVYNGVEAPAPTLRRRGGPYRLLYAARFMPAKGADLVPAILRAAWAAAARGDVVVTVAGAGPLEPEIRRGMEGATPGWTVEITGPIERLSERLGEWDGVLMPSRFEGLGLLAIEALLAGVPLAATDAPGLAEVLPSDYPFRAPVGDAEAMGAVLARMIDREEDARATVAPLRQDMITRFSPETMAQGYRLAYADLLREAAA